MVGNNLNFLETKFNLEDILQGLYIKTLYIFMAGIQQSLVHLMDYIN